MTEPRKITYKFQEKFITYSKYFNLQTNKYITDIATSKYVPVPKWRIFRAKEPRSRLHPHEENGHLEGAMAVKNNGKWNLHELMQVFICQKYRIRRRNKQN
jgi:hypothetical protein